MNITLYFGSFNPIHLGHLSIAKYMLNNALCDRLWLVVSPENPLKDPRELSSEIDRLNMCSLALNESGLSDRVSVCDVEFDMPKPSWTIDTLCRLSEKYPLDTFSMVIGADNLADFKKWREWERILDMVTVYVYPRKGSNVLENRELKSIVYMDDAPIFDIDATTIRAKWSDKAFVNTITLSSVVEYAKNKNIYK